ncbi:MAG: Rho termination factor [Euryarchaeota archaeon]|nr:Rho termination factor [Euryarchaeota archaeon]
MPKDPEIKDEERYLQMRRRDRDKELATRLARTSRHRSGGAGATAPPLEEWSHEELVAGARGLGIESPSKLDREELIEKIEHAAHESHPLSEGQERG